MVIAITASCSRVLHTDNTARPEFNALLGSFSPTRTSNNNNNNNSRALRHGTKCHARGAPRTARAILADPTAKRAMPEQPAKKPQTEDLRGTSTPATTGSEPTPEMGLLDSSLESTLEHRLWVGFGVSATLGMISKAVLATHGSMDVAGIALGALAAYVLADLGTGVYHWGIDNYGGATTPVFGPQIDAFQGHHRRPWTITKREFSNNLQAVARPVGFALVPFLLLPSNPTADTFLAVFLGLIGMSQQFHSWAHGKKSQLPAAVSYLQEHGILISRKMHGVHHRAPYSVNYCIVSGLWNSTLNDSNFFPRLEAAIYSRWGVAPRNWADTVASEWTQDGSYFEDGSDFKLDREL